MGQSSYTTRPNRGYPGVRENEGIREDPAFFVELADVCAGLSRAASARVVVLAAAGKHFCAGMSLDVFTDPRFAGDATPEARWNMTRRVEELQAPLTAFELLPMPVIAVIQRGCVGGGFDLAAACDLRIATEDAFFQIQETNVAMMADLGSLQRLPKLIAPAIVREFAYTGRRWTAREAAAAGFINGIDPDHESALAAAREMATEIAKRSPIAVAASKAAILHAMDHSVPDSLRQAAALQDMVWSTERVNNAARAVRAKTTASYSALASFRSLGDLA